MISKEAVTPIVTSWLAGKDYFLVDITVSDDNSIVVEIDHADGVWLDDCVALSRYIEEHLDRDKEDYNLEVGSAGVGQPFKVTQQYVNHIGKEVEVADSGGTKYQGVLTSVDDDTFVVTVEEKVVVEGRKRPVRQPVPHTFRRDSIQYCKYVFHVQ